MPDLFNTSLVVLLLLVILLGVGFLYFYWWMVQRSVPTVTGKLVLTCLNQPAEVLRDRHGIPHIYAHTLADLVRAQGFVHAQDRMWQMEQNRRIAQGRLAELFGEPALAIDRYSRILGFWRAAEAELTALDADTHQILEWYCQGVNEYIGSRPGRLSAELNLLRRQPTPWTPADTLGLLKVMGWNLSLNWESELTRVRLALQMDAVHAADLEPDYPKDNPVILEGVDSQQAMRLQSTAGLLLGEYDQIKGWLGSQGWGLGSNCWAVAAKRSLNNRPLLCNDPHLPITIPGIWYENHVNCPELQVAGAIFPGVPGVLIGHNHEMAWGLANACVDVQDLYLEQPHPDDPTRFAYGGEWEQAQVIEEQILVRGRDVPHTERVTITRHGPLINALVADSNTVPLSVRWTGHDPGHTVRSIVRLNQAGNRSQFTAALADWAVPPLNFVYADSAENIGYVMAGRVPVRQNGLGLLPAPGWQTDHEWVDWIPAGELPSLVNPASGFIVTANNKIVGDDFPYWLGMEYSPGWRAHRIEEMLAQKEKHTVRDMERIQLDTTSVLARALTPWLTLLYSDDPWEKSAVGALRDWSYRMEIDSDAALLYHYALLQLLEMTFGDKLGSAKAGFMGRSISPLFAITGFAHRATTRLLELLSGHEESVWYTEAATGRHRSRDELLQEALTAAVAGVRRDVSDSSRRWAWGRIHQVRYVHAMGSVRLFRSLFNRGPFPVGGDATTPNQSSFAPQLPPGLVQVAPSYRQILEVDSWDRSLSVTPSGQSGHPLSPNYADQMAMWREGVYHKMPWSRGAVEQNTDHRLQLTPN